MAELNSLILNGKDISEPYPRVIDDALGLIKYVFIEGDSSYYYPVWIIPHSTSNYRPNIFTVSKTLGSATASYSGNHSNGTSSCSITCLIRHGGWDGNGNWAKTLAAQQPYAVIVGTIQLHPHNGSFVVWLRGGGTRYTLYMDVPYDTYIYYSTTNIGSSTYPHNVEPTTSYGNAGVINTGNTI